MTKEQTVIGPKSPKQEMILNSTADITVIGGAAGSGKSYLLQMMPLPLVDDPNTTCIMFRRTTPQIRGQGGLLDLASEIYSKLPKMMRPKIKSQALEAKFPTGARVRWSHMENIKDKFNHQGLQYTFIGFDEGTQFEWEQIEYLMSRLRSSSKHKSRMAISCNPDPDHKLCELIDWWLDDDGFPIPERDGVHRYFIMLNGDYVFSDTADELKAKYGDDVLPLSFTFISATIDDNPVLLKSNPQYVSWLEGLNPVDKARLRYGNWYARPEGSNYVKRDWIRKLDKEPFGCKAARGWDKAATEPSDVNKFPDFTASIKMLKTKDGDYIIKGDFHPDNHDKVDLEIKGRFRRRSGDRDNLILKQAQYDGEECIVIFPEDVGAAGKMEFTQSSKALLEEGFVVKKDPMPTQRSKLNRFTPFAAACENGHVCIIESSFPDKKTLESFYKELESFSGERSSSSRKDD